MMKKRYSVVFLVMLLWLFVTLQVSAAEKKTAINVSLSKTSVTLYKGQKITLTASVTGSSKAVSWKTSNKSIATVSKKGTNKAQIVAKKTGTVTIKAYIGKSVAQTKITVKKPTTTLNKTSVSITKGSTKQLKASVNGSSQKVTWSTSNKKVAKVSSTGKVTAVKAGTATITAKANGVTAKCKVTVKNEAVTEVKLKYNSLSNAYESYTIQGLSQKGKTVWEFSTGKKYLSGAQISEVAVTSDDNYVYLIEHSYFYKLNKATGKKIKQKKINISGITSLYADENNVYAVQFLGDDVVYVISKNGALMRTISFNSKGNGGAAIKGKTGNYLVIGFDFAYPEGYTTYVPVS